MNFQEYYWAQYSWLGNFWKRGCYSEAFTDWLLPRGLNTVGWILEGWHCQLFANFWKLEFTGVRLLLTSFHRLSEVISNVFSCSRFWNLAKGSLCLPHMKNKLINSQSPLLFFLSQTLRRDHKALWEGCLWGHVYELMLPLNYLIGNYSERKIALTTNFL